MTYLKGAPLLRSLTWLTGAWNLLYSMAMVALVLHAQENLGLGAQGYGLLLAAGAVAGVAGAVWGGRIVRRLGPRRATRWPLASLPPIFLAMALAPRPVALSAALAVLHFAVIVYDVVAVSYRQRSIPDRLLGRVNALYRFLVWGAMPVGALLSGLVVRAAEGMVPREAALLAPFVLAAIGAVPLALAGWRPLGRAFDGG